MNNRMINNSTRLSNLVCHGFIPTDSSHLYITGLTANDRLTVPLATFWTTLFRALGVSLEALVDDGVAETLANLQQQLPDVEVEHKGKVDSEGQLWLVAARLICTSERHFNRSTNPVDYAMASRGAMASRESCSAISPRRFVDRFNVTAR
jgi:hypothetical protein